METLLLFCCQSCLKSDSDIEYYLTLDITPQASYDEVKRAYKKRSLQLHPDRLAQKGIQVTADHNLQFQKLKEAYDVLSDPRKRKIYDKIGKSGLKLVDSPQEINPRELLRNFQNNKADRLRLVLLIFLICCFIIIFPILFCLKCDGRIDNVPWVGLWTPMWLLDCVLIIASILFLMERDDDDDDEENDPERGGGNSHGNGSHGEGERKDGDSSPKNKHEKIPFSVKFFFAARSFCFVLLQIFVMMKLDDYLDSWSWFAIFAPWFGYEFFAIVDMGPILFETVAEPDAAELERRGAELDEHERTQLLLSTQEEYFKKLIEQTLARKSFLVSILRVWLACFLALQLDHIVSWDWGLVLLPIWCYFLLEILHGYFMKRWGVNVLSGIDLEACVNGEITDPTILLRAQHGQELMAASSMEWCALGPTVFMAVLLVSRLEAATFSTFIILIPVFAFLGCCMCGVACGFCAFSCLDTSGFDEEEGVPQQNCGGGGEGDVETGMEAELPSVMKCQTSSNSSEPLTTVHLPPPAAPVAAAPVVHSNTEPAVTVTHIDADID